MAATAAFRRFGIGALTLSLIVVSGLRADDADSDSTSAPTKAATPSQLLARATAAERAGDWEAAFTLYCHLYIADRTTPALREKLTNALRRVQQIRRHRDLAFQNFTIALPQGDALNLFAEVMNKVPRAYAEPQRATAQHLWGHGVEELDRALGNPVFQQVFLENPAPEQIETFRVKLRAEWSRYPVRNAKEARSALRMLINAAQDECPFRVPSAIVVEFMCGACCGLDEYTVYLSPAALTPDPAAAADLTEYGIYLAYHDGGLFIDGVAVGSWAAFNTNLRKGDRVARINGRPMEMPSAAMVATALRNPIGNGHELETAPLGADMLPGVARLPLSVPTVYGARILNSKDGIGYVRVGSIQPSTPRELELAISELRTRGMRALVLDLRGNHGGDFLAGVDVAKQFLPAGVIVTAQGQTDGSNRVFSSESGMSAFEMPLVVLIDTETASAAEVVAAALKDNNRASLVGMPTFGKGAIQYPLKLSALDDPTDPTRAGVRSGAVRLTIARLLSPSGAPINGVGVTPDLLSSDWRCQEEMGVERAVELLAMPGRPVVPIIRIPQD